MSSEIKTLMDSGAARYPELRQMDGQKGTRGAHAKAVVAHSAEKAEQISQLREQIRQGTYQINPVGLAARLIAGGLLNERE